MLYGSSYIALKSAFAGVGNSIEVDEEADLEWDNLIKVIKGK